MKAKQNNLTQDEVNCIVNFFYKDDRKELKIICDQILRSIWRDIPDSYRDDFESLAGLVIMDCVRDYNPETGSFRAYVYPCMKRKFISLIYEINTLKRGGDGNWDNKEVAQGKEKIKKTKKVNFVSIDDRISDEVEATYAEIIAGDSYIEDELFKNELSPELEKYLSKLSKIQRKIVFLIMDDYKPSEIQEKLMLSNKQYFYYVNELKTSELHLALVNRY